MNDLISRAAVLDYIDSMPFEVTEDGHYMIRRVRLTEYISDTLPPAQPEIVRCKDCKHYRFADNRVPSEQSWVCDAWGVDQTAHTGYCFKAERRTDE